MWGGLLWRDLAGELVPGGIGGEMLELEGA
jgi:hypothetical protein